MTSILMSRVWQQGDQGGVYIDVEGLAPIGPT